MVGPMQIAPDMERVKQALAKLLEQQQAGEPSPRQPTPEESQQLHQAAQQLVAGGDQAPPSPASGPSRADLMGRQPAPPQAPAPQAPQGNPYAGMAAGGGFGGPSPEMMKTPGNPNAPGAAKPEPEAGPPPANPYAGIAAGMGYGAPNANLLRSAPGKPHRPHDETAQETVSTLNDAFAKITGNYEPKPQDAEKILFRSPQGEMQEPPADWPAQRDGNAPTGVEDGEGARAAEFVETEAKARQRPDLSEQMKEHANSAAKEVAQGAGSIDDVDRRLRDHFGDDPDLDDAIRETRARLGEINSRGGAGPFEYAMMALLIFAGADPFKAAEVITRSGQTQRDEEGAQRDLLQLQLQKVGNRRQARMMEHQDDRTEKLFAHQKDLYGEKREAQAGAMDRKQEFKANENGVNNLRAIRGQLKTSLDVLEQAGPAATPEQKAKKMRLEADIRAIDNILLNPVIHPKEAAPAGGGPQSFAPQTMRLLGIGGANA